MSTYPYTHEKGSLLYQVENYKFRYKGILAASIELIIVPGERIGFNYEIEENNQHWPELPSKYYKGSSNSQEVYEALQMNFVGMFDTKEEALQNAIYMIEGLLNKYITADIS